MEAVDDLTFFRDRSTYVTGATGLLGSWVTEALLHAGARVVVLVRDRNALDPLRRFGLWDKVDAAFGTVEDQPLQERVLGEFEVESVFHLAAQTIVGIANRNPVSTFESNIRGTWSLLEACRRSPLVKQIVLASSDKAYGDQDLLPYTEKAPLQGLHPYDLSKACADRIAQCYAACFDLPVTVTRFGNLYGPGDVNFNRLVPGTIRSVLRGIRPIIRSDGTFTRDYFFVRDGAHAYLHLCRQMAQKPEIAGRAYNFSNERPMRVLELVRLILAIMESDLLPDVRNEARHEIRHQYLDATRAHADLGWAPQFTLEEGLRETIAWYRRELLPLPGANGPGAAEGKGARPES